MSPCNRRQNPGEAIEAVGCEWAERCHRRGQGRLFAAIPRGHVLGVPAMATLFINTAIATCKAETGGEGFMMGHENSTRRGGRQHILMQT